MKEKGKRLIKKEKIALCQDKQPIFEGLPKRKVKRRVI